MQPLLALRALNRSYTNGDVVVHALRDINLSIAVREFVAVVGTSGSGKSTLMNTLGCLDRPTSGDYRLDGQEVSKLSYDELSVTNCISPSPVRME